MAIHVHVIIVGLTTLLNLQGAADFSDPSVVAPKYAGHQAFIAYRDRDVTSNASKLVKNKGYSSLSVDMERVSLGGDPAGTPIFPDDTFDCMVAHFSHFSDLSKFTYDLKLVPPLGKDPDGSAVVMYVPLGGGSVTAQNLTKSSWEFLDKEHKKKPHKRSARKFARSVTYSYDLPQDTKVLTVSLWTLGSPTTTPPSRIVKFTPVNGNTITIYIGNSGDWYSDVTQHSPSQNGSPSQHFDAYYKFVTNDPPIHYIPFPATKTPDLGYCGPTGLP
jgi:hypothetical protein